MTRAVAAVEESSGLLKGFMVENHWHHPDGPRDHQPDSELAPV